MRFLFTKKRNLIMKMDVFFEAKLIVRILYFLMQFAIIHVDADKFECIKYDECSCRIKTTTTQHEISLWPMPSHEKTESGFSNWLFDFNLCHGLNKNTDAQDGGCRNATVCQYSDSNKNETYEVGKFGNVTFGQYDNETKSITLQYYGRPQENKTRSISIHLKCHENWNVNQADYNEVTVSPFNPTKFTIMIASKAACLRPPRTSSSTSPSTIPNTTSGTLPSTTPNTLPSTTPSTIPSTSPRSSPSTSPSTTPGTTPNTSSSTSSSTSPYSTPVTLPSTTRNTSLGSTTPSRNLSTSPKTTPRTSASSVTSGGKLKTVYIVLIVIAGFVPVLAIGFHVAYKIFRKRRRGYHRLLIEDEDSEGIVSAAHTLDPCSTSLSIPV